MTVIELDDIGISLGIALPEYYKNLMTSYPLEIEDAGEFELINYPEKLIEENKRAYIDLWGRPLNKKYFIIGENGCGDYFLIDLDSDKGVMWFEHESNAFFQISKTLMEYTLKIANGTYESALGNDECKIPDLRLNSSGTSWFRKIFGSN